MVLATVYFIIQNTEVSWQIKLSYQTSGDITFTENFVAEKILTERIEYQLFFFIMESNNSVCTVSNADLIEWSNMIS